MWSSTVALESGTCFVWGVLRVETQVFKQVTSPVVLAPFRWDWCLGASPRGVVDVQFDRRARVRHLFLGRGFEEKSFILKTFWQ